MSRKVSLRVRDMEGVDDPHDLWWPKPEKGKASVMQVRVDMDVRETVATLIAHRQGPWETENDFGRCAVGYYLLLVQAKLKNGRFKTALQTLQLRAMSARTEKRVADIADYLASVQESARKLWKMGMVKEARKLIHDVLRQEWDDTMATNIITRWGRSRMVKQLLEGRPDEDGEEE